jgi:hypothetical protein
MFDSISSERSPLFRIVFRAVFSLGAGAILAFVLPWLLIAIEYVSPAFGNGFLMKSVFTVLNLPGAIYCTLFSTADKPPNSDQALYCFAIGIFLNIPFYALVIFLLSSWFERRRNKKLQLEADR